MFRIENFFFQDSSTQSAYCSMTFLFGITGRRIIFSIRMLITFLSVIAYIPVMMKIAKVSEKKAHMTTQINKVPFEKTTRFRDADQILVFMSPSW